MESPRKPLNIISPLHKALRLVSAYLEESTLSVGPLEGNVLAFVACFGPFTVGQVGRVFGLKASSLTGLLDRLEKQDLIVRRKNPRDRRSYLIDVTDQGRELGYQARRVIEDLETDILGRVDDQDRAGFDRVMAAVAEATKSAGP